MAAVPGSVIFRDANLANNLCLVARLFAALALGAFDNVLALLYAAARQQKEISNLVAHEGDFVLLVEKDDLACGAVFPHDAGRIRRVLEDVFVAQRHQHGTHMGECTLKSNCMERMHHEKKTTDNYMSARGVAGGRGQYRLRCPRSEE